LLSGNTSNRDSETGHSNLQIGWAATDITPEEPVFILGQFYARISEGVRDPVTATILAMESGSGSASDKAIFISCDLGIISDELYESVRKQVTTSLPELLPKQIVITATHSHSAPHFLIPKTSPLDTASTSEIERALGVELDAMEFSKCLAFMSERIAKATVDAWKNRKPGGIGFGLGHAVVSHNRLAVDLSGKSKLYGKTDQAEFSHIEGYEDHSVNLLYTWDTKSKLTGVVINVASPSQVSEHEFLISADYWHDVKVELGKRLGKDVYVLPQCSAAGDQSPHFLVGARAEERMQHLMGTDPEETGRGSIGRRKQIALEISNAVTSVLPYMSKNIEWSPIFSHQQKTVELSRRLISEEDVEAALTESKSWESKYNEMLHSIEENPGIKQENRWYRNITIANKRMRRGFSVKERYDLQKIQPTMPVDVHVIRVGDVVMATNPFELYLDYGIQIKGRSPAIQTFVVQLCGGGTYVPTPRAVEGGGYGAVPASTLIGPKGGQELVEYTLEMINDVYEQ
jgi:hypothetical protein